MAVTVAGFVGSFQLSAQKWIEQAVPADLFVTASAKIAGVQNQQLPASLMPELEHAPGVDKVNPIRILSHDVLGLRVFILSLIPDVYNERGKPQVIAGTLPTPEERDRNYVTISENLARRRNLHPGDSFPVKTPTGDHQYVVGAVIIDYTSDQGTVFMDRVLYTRDFKDDQIDTFHVYVKDLTRLEEVRQGITAKWGKQYDLYVLSNAELREEAYNMVGNAFKITWAMEFVAMVLALLGVINTLLAAVLDRTREIGLLRAIGADRRHVQRLFTGEAAFIGLTGGVIGTTVGAVVGYIVTKVVGVQATGWDFPFHYPFQIAAQMFVASWFCAILAGLYPARRASSLDVVEALAYE
jgi:putative ABC transport system permease protein